MLSRRLAALFAVLAAGRAVAARAADPCATPAGTVRGTVGDTGGPLASARVRVQGCLGDPVPTAADGSFTLSVPAGGVVITASADGHYVGCWKNGTVDCDLASAGATGLAIVLDPLPTDDDPAHVFRDPERCKACHPAIYDQWSRSTMAFTNRNRWVDNLYNGTDLSMPPGPAPDPNDPPYFGFLSRHNLDANHPTRTGECANCHQPEYVGTSPTDSNFNAASGAGSHGVSCGFCHHVVDVDVSPAGITRPNLVVGVHGAPAKTTMLRSTAEPWLAFGPLDDVTFPGVPDMRAAYAPVTGSSRLCAACHEDSADPRDANDDFLGTYDGPASQTTYSEWAASDWAQRGVQCQDCHMPPTGDTQFCQRTSNQRDPSQVRSHAFEGTSPAFLRRAVTLRTRATAADDVLTVDVAVTNSGAGHSVPTGVTLRNLILVVQPTLRDGTALTQLEAHDGGGPRVQEWGGVGNAASGNFAGLPGTGYARVLIDRSFVENVLFTEAVRAFDNRIAAGATDTTRYRFRLPAGTSLRDVRVDTRLYYRRAFKPIADQRKWNVPLNGNAHGTTGTGADYDENLVVASTRNFLVCRGKVGALKLAGKPSDGTLAGAGLLKLPARTALDPVADGVELTLAPTGAAPVVQDELGAFHVEKKTAVYDGAEATDVRTLRLTRVGRRGVRLELALGDLTADTLAARRLDVVLASGDVCFRRTLRCKAVRGGGVRCR